MTLGQLQADLRTIEIASTSIDTIAEVASAPALQDVIARYGLDQIEREVSDCWARLVTT